jgi:nucleotidyltransferase/DNA polymerase involved in DNA repair
LAQPPAWAGPTGRARLGETEGVALWVLHVDLDQFIAAVEVLRHPELRGRPVVVGGDGDPAKRGVVATASYEARAHGVHSGLPMRTALRRCPDAVFLPVDKPAYEAVSATVMAVLQEFDAVVEVMGWDEAFLAVETEDPEGVARRSSPRPTARPLRHPPPPPRRSRRLPSRHWTSSTGGARSGSWACGPNSRVSLAGRDRAARGVRCLPRGDGSHPRLGPR